MHQWQKDPLTWFLIKRIQALSSPLLPVPTSVPERFSSLRHIRAVLFDLYGTLFISGSGDIGSSSDLARAQMLQEALIQAGYTGDLIRASTWGIELFVTYIQKSHAQRRQEGIEYPEVDIRVIWQEVLSTLLTHRLMQGDLTVQAVLQVAVEYECRVNPVWPMPGMQAVLATLRQKRIILGIVSNAQFYTPLLFPAFLSNPLATLRFEPSLCIWSYERLEAKPSIHLFQRAGEVLRHQYHCLPQETLYVGNDLLNDIWPARQVGWKTALFAGDTRSLRLRPHDPRCTHLDPDLILTDFSQLITILK